MSYPANSLTAFWDGFTLSGLFGFAKLPGGAETLVEETTDLSQSQFAELLMPFSKAKSFSGENASSGMANPVEFGGEVESISSLEIYESAVESFDIDQQIAAFLGRRGLPADPIAVRLVRNRVLAKAFRESAKQSGELSQRKNFA